jgi:hypothetical protein
MAERALSRNLHLFGLTLPSEHAASRQALWQRLLNEGEVNTTAAATGQTNNYNNNAAGHTAPRPAREQQAARRNPLRNTSIDDAWSASSSSAPAGNTAVDSADGSTVQVFQEWNGVAGRSRSTTAAAAEEETVGNFEAQLLLSEGGLRFCGARGIGGRVGVVCSCAVREMLDAVYSPVSLDLFSFGGCCQRVWSVVSTCIPPRDRHLLTASPRLLPIDNEYE